MTFSEMKQIFFLWRFQLICWFYSNKLVVFNAITKSIMISWSHNGIKMQSSYLLILLGYIDKRILTRISTSPGGYPGIFPRPRGYPSGLFLLHHNCITLPLYIFLGKYCYVPAGFFMKVKLFYLEMRRCCSSKLSIHCHRNAIAM